MRIGIDASTWSNGRGFGRFTREIVKALLRLPTDHEFHLFSDNPSALSVDSGNARVIPVGASKPVTESAVSDRRRGMLDVLAFSRAVVRSRPDVMFYPAVYSWFPCPPGIPVVLTLHDAIAEHFPDLVFPGWKNRQLWRLKVKLACMQATRYLTVSNAAREEIHRHLGIDRNLIDLTTEGPNEAFKPPEDSEAREQIRQDTIQAFGLHCDARILVYVGGFAPHKNLIRLLDALAELKDDSGFDDVRLLMVGDHSGHGFHSNYDEIAQRIESDHRLRGSVVFTGFVTDEALAGIYASSVALVLPSLSEGFGLPAVEAMSCGTPVLASNRGPLPEIVGEAGRLFDPSSTREIAEAMAGILECPREGNGLRATALAQAERFTWEAGAESVLETLERCGNR